MSRAFLEVKSLNSSRPGNPRIWNVAGLRTDFPTTARSRRERQIDGRAWGEMLSLART